MSAPARGPNGKFTAGNRAARDARSRKRQERADRRDARLYLRRARPLPDRPPLAEISAEALYGLGAYYDHPGYGCTPARLVSILYAAETGDLRTQCRLIDDLVEGDTTLRNLLEQRRGAVSSKPREICAGAADDGSKQLARALAWALSTLPMKKVLDHLLTHNQYGYACVNIDWGIRVFEGRAWVLPVWLQPVAAERFTVDPDTDELRLRTKDGSEALRPGEWWILRKGCGPVARAALGRTFCWPALYKRYGTTDWVVYARKFGLPLTVVKVPERASPDVKETAQAVVDNIGSDGGAVVETPSDGIGDVTIEIHEVQAANASTTHGALATYCNREMAKLINGSTLSSSSEDSGGASYALGEVHDEVRYENVEDDEADLGESFVCCVSTPVMQWNALSSDTRAATLEVQIVRNHDPAKQMDLIERAVELGVPVSRTQIRQVTGAREPLGPEDAIERAAPQPQRPGAATPSGDAAPAQDAPPSY